MFPQYSKWERIADAIVHTAGVLFSFLASALLMIQAAAALAPGVIAGLAVYSFGLISMFGASASYNLVNRPRLKDILRRLDHAAIFIMIAGSYTPFALIIGGTAGPLLIAAEWSIAIAGVVLKLRFPRRFEAMSIALYLAQGWIILLAIGPLVAAVPQRALLLLFVGGCLYTAGVAFHLLRRMPYHNVIWHAFVLAAAICHYESIRSAALA